MIARVLIYNSGGGIGDSIQLFPLILTLQKIYQESENYYLGAHENHFLGKLKDYNINVNNLDLGIRYFGFRWWHLFAVRGKVKNLNMVSKNTHKKHKKKNILVNVIQLQQGVPSQQGAPGSAPAPTAPGPEMGMPEPAGWGAPPPGPLPSSVPIWAATSTTTTRARS